MGNTKHCTSCTMEFAVGHPSTGRVHRHEELKCSQCDIKFHSVGTTYGTAICWVTEEQAENLAPGEFQFGHKREAVGWASTR